MSEPTSDTPRTDTEVIRHEPADRQIVSADFARELERELREAKFSADRWCAKWRDDGDALSRENAKLRADKARYEFCKRHMMVCTHGLAPGVTDINMMRVPVDCVMGGADEIIDRAMMPGTAANVQRMIDDARASQPL